MNTWRKSSYSTATGNCVEVAPTADRVIMRHSKHPAAGTIAFTHPAWALFLRGVPNGVASITKIGTDTVIASSGIELRFDAGEWSAFRAGVADGEFDFA